MQVHTGGAGATLPGTGCAVPVHHSRPGARRVEGGARWEEREGMGEEQLLAGVR